MTAENYIISLLILKNHSQIMVALKDNLLLKVDLSNSKIRQAMQHSIQMLNRGAHEDADNRYDGG